jgi:hypothetical protein
MKNRTFLPVRGSRSSQTARRLAIFVLGAAFTVSAAMTSPAVQRAEASQSIAAPRRRPRRAPIHKHPAANATSRLGACRGGRSFEQISASA